MFFKNKIIRYIFFVSLFICILYPLINIYFIYPTFTDLLVRNTENEAIRLGTHLSKEYFENEEPLSQNDVESIRRFVKEDVKSFNLMKMKIFTPDGEIIFSTDAKDIGVINENDYYHNIVAKGKPFTKVVKKDAESLEGQKSK